MDLLEMGRFEALKDTVNLNTKILCRGDFVRKAMQRIQIGMIKPIKEICLRECIELREIANHSCHRIDLAT
jgi:hypothetical protein